MCVRKKERTKEGAHITYEEIVPLAKDELAVRLNGDIRSDGIGKQSYSSLQIIYIFIIRSTPGLTECVKTVFTFSKFVCNF